MSGEPIPVAIKVMDKEYMISCPAEERESLLQAARHLDQKMREVRDSGKVLGTERMAVMAALNISHELLHAQNDLRQATGSVNEDVNRLLNKIEASLGRRPNREAVD